MRLTEYERKAAKEIEAWHSGSGNPVQWLLDTVTKPVDWAVEQFVPDSLLAEAESYLAKGLEILNDASQWTHDDADVLTKAQAIGLSFEKIEELQDKDLEKLDLLAKSYFTENAILAAVQGAGVGLGGIALALADIPLLFTINFRLIQQIGASYGFSMRGTQFTPLILAIYNVSIAGNQEAKKNAIREVGVAAAAFAHDMDYKGKKNAGKFQDQMRDAVRQLTKPVLRMVLEKSVPLVGAAIGAGVNYWFTSQTAETAYMMFRMMYLERKERM